MMAVAARRIATTNEATRTPFKASTKKHVGEFKLLARLAEVDFMELDKLRPFGYSCAYYPSNHGRVHEGDDG